MEKLIWVCVITLFISVVISLVIVNVYEDVKNVSDCNDNIKERIAMCEGKYMGKVLWTSQGEYCQTQNTTFRLC